MRRRWHWPRLFGPLFGYDLVASTRRGQHASLRVLIAVGLLVVIFFVYIAHSHDYGLLTDPFKPGRLMDGNQMAAFARAFVGWCLIVQFVAVLLLTPSVVADAIAREKERRALDFLFVTDLTNREIIFGKLGARLAYLFGVLLTGVPVLALTQLWGGVDDVLLYGGYAALFATLLSLGALSMLCSVSSQTALQATVRAYAAGSALLTVCGCLLVPIFEGDSALPGVITYVVANLAFAAVSLFVCVRELRPWAEFQLVVPSPVVPARHRPTPSPSLRGKGVGGEGVALQPPHPRPLSPEAGERGENSDDDLPFVLPANEKALPRDDAWDSPEPWGAPAKRQPLPVWDPLDLPRVPLPPVSDERPLLWKEVCLHSFARGQAGAAAPLLLTLLALGAVVDGVFLLVALLDPSSRGSLAAASNMFVWIGTAILASLLGLGVMIHAANSVTRERERDTLEGLLTLPVDRAEVLEAKWLGGLVSLRLVPAALGCVWFFGLLTGGIHPLALARLVLAVAAPVEFLASLGLWQSVVCRTSLRASLAAVLCLLLVGAGPWITSNYVEIFFPNSGPQSEVREVLTQALMPPLTWAKLCLTWADYRALPAHRAEYLLMGSLVYAAAAWLLWRAAVRRFRRQSGRMAG